MKAVFADTFYCRALLNARDAAHKRAVAASRTPGLSLVTTELVLLELADALCKPPQREEVPALWNVVATDPAFQCVRATSELIQRDRKLYLERADKEWSLTDCISFVPDAKRRFLELVLRLGIQVDAVIKRQGNRMKNMSLLGKHNQQLLLNAVNGDSVRNRLRLNRIYGQIDRTKVFPDYRSEFSRGVSGIAATKLQKEGLYSKLIIGACIVLGFLLAGASPFAVVLVFIGAGFWGVNHFAPVFLETRKLKNALCALVDGMQSQPGVYPLSAA